MEDLKTLFMPNGIDGECVNLNSTAITIEAMDIQMLPILRRIMENIEVPEDCYLWCLQHDDYADNEYEYKIGNIDLLKQDECFTDQAIGMCTNCRYVLFIRPEYLDDFNMYMNYIFNRKVE